MPWVWCAMPPSSPPAKAPRNWEVEKNPMAVPLAAAGAILATREGSEASTRLKAVKYSNRAASMP